MLNNLDHSFCSLNIIYSMLLLIRFSIDTAIDNAFHLIVEKLSMDLIKSVFWCFLNSLCFHSTRMDIQLFQFIKNLSICYSYPFKITLLSSSLNPYKSNTKLSILSSIISICFAITFLSSSNSTCLSFFCAKSI